MSITKTKNTSRYLGYVPTRPSQDYMYVEDRIHKIYKVVVHRFLMSDVEDLEIYAAEPIWKWQQSEVGQWVMQKAVESPVWHQLMNQSTMSYQYAITAKLKEKDYTFWCLKYANQVDSY